MIKHFLAVGIGGAVGSMFRYATALITLKYFHGIFPLATFIANIAGCFLIGLLMGTFGGEGASNHQLRLLLVTGFCGGYTTFSAFSYENVLLFNNHNAMLAAGYIFASVLAGVGAVWIGLKIA
jgi:CrcB protein